MSDHGERESLAAGLSGGEGSADKRAALIKELQLPAKLTATGLLDVLNAIMTRDEFLNLK